MGSLVSADLRARIRAGAEPIGRLFGRVGLTPNMLTLIGFGIACLGGVLAAQQSWLATGLVVAFGAVFDLFDGALARATGTTSRLGAFLDSTFDRAGEAVVYVGVAVGAINAGFDVGAVLAISAMAAAFIVSYVRAKAESLGFSPASGMANVGLAPREVRIAILVIGLVLLSFAGPIGPWTFTCPTDLLVLCLEPTAFQAGGLVLGATLVLITILATITSIQRIVHVYLQSKKER